MISINNFNDSIKSTYLFVIYSIVDKTNEENYYYLFKEFINNFSNILSTSQKNEEIFYTILKICSNLSIDDKLCEEMIKTGLGYIFYNSLSVPNLERDYVIKLLKIFSNFFYFYFIILYFMNNYV